MAEEKRNRDDYLNKINSTYTKEMEEEEEAILRNSFEQDEKWLKHKPRFISANEMLSARDRYKKQASMLGKIWKGSFKLMIIVSILLAIFLIVKSFFS